MVGNEFTVTIVPADAADVQLPLVTVTVYVPEADTVIDCVVAPLDQRFPVADDDVKTTLPPVQKVVGPPAVIVGVAGAGVTVIVLAVDGFEVQPFTVVVTV